jgi:hypothetical protein
MIKRAYAFTSLDGPQLEETVTARGKQLPYEG